MSCSSGQQPIYTGSWAELHYVPPFKTVTVKTPKSSLGWLDITSFEVIPCVKSLNSGPSFDGWNQPLTARFVDSIEGDNSSSVDFLLLNGKLKGRRRIHPHQCQIILCNTEPELLLNGPPQKTGVSGVCGMFANLLAGERCSYCWLLPTSLFDNRHS